MSITKKYGRTFHYPFSPGTTNDDRINYNYWEHMASFSRVVHTEKLDGENNCLSSHGVYARSHAAPTTSPWTQDIRARWSSIRHDLGDLEIFGENLYAIHSIEYRKLEHHFYVFAVRQLDRWLSWEEVKFFAAMFDFPTVPELTVTKPVEERLLKEQVLTFASSPSSFDSWDVENGQPCSREGIVTRDVEGFSESDFGRHLLKYVRKGHVKTDEHWTRKWRRAKLIHEQRQIQ